MATVTPLAARRPRAYVRVQGPDAVDYLQPDALERRARGGLGRRAAPHREGARDRAAPRLAARRRRLPAAHRARARRGRARPADPHALRGEVRDRARGAHLDDRLRRRPTGIPNRDYGVPAVEVLDAEVDDARRRRARAAADRGRRRRGSAASSTTACCPPRPVSTSGRSRSRRAAIPGQEPIARQHYRGKVNRRLRVLDVDGAPPAGDAGRATAGRTVGRVTSAVPGLALAYVRVEVPDDAELDVDGRRPARLHWPLPRARSSGDRALPCGGRGRKFESCRAHFVAVCRRR